MPRAVVHPLWWAAVGVLLLNDHVLKGAGVLPGWLTGKLSDVVGLIVLPPLLALLFGADRPGRRMLAMVVSGAALAGVNLWPAAARGLEVAMGALGLSARVWVDPTDLLALPALLLAWPLCRPLEQARAGLALTVQRLALAIAAFACVATTTSDDDEKSDADDAPALENRTAGSLTLLIASTEGAGGCRLYRDDRIAAITLDAFVNRREVTLAEDERVPLAEVAPTDCGAAWVLLPDGDEIFVHWRDLDPIDGFVPEDDGSRLARLITVEGRDGRYTSDLGDDLFRFELGDEPPNPSCPTEEVEHSLEWSLPASPQGFFELDEVRTADDGCLEVDWISQSDDTAEPDTQRLCVPEWAFPFEAREVLSLLLERGERGGHRLQISRIEEEEVTLQLVLFADAGEDLLGDTPVQGLEADDCFGGLSACGAYLRPAELTLDGDDDPLRAGDDAELDSQDADTHRVLVGATRFVDWSSGSCEGAEARRGGSASWLELREF